MEAAARRRWLAAMGLRDWAPVAPAAAPRTAPVEAATVSRVEEVAPPPALARAPTPAVESPPAILIPQRPPITTLDEARACVADCRACRLHETRTQTVFGVGPAAAPLMVVGEGPGADEDARGEPFVGRAGKLLDQMLRAIGHDRGENAYIANVVKCRPPNNRDPQADEAEACRDFLEAQIRLVRPRLILAVGRVAAQRLLQTEESLSRLRGRFHSYGPEATPLWITYHPAYLLRSPREKAKAWVDLKQVHAFLNGG